MLFLITLSLFPALMLRFLLIRKPFGRKTALQFAGLIAFLAFIPGATVLKSLGFGASASSTIIFNMLLWTYPILRCGSKKKVDSHSVSSKPEIERIPLEDGPERNITKWRT